MDNKHITPFSIFLDNISNSVSENKSLSASAIDQHGNSLRYRTYGNGIPKEIDPQYVEALFEAVYNMLVDKRIGDWVLHNDLNDEIYVLEFSPTYPELKNSYAFTLDVYPFSHFQPISLSYGNIYEEITYLGINFYDTDEELTGNANIDAKNISAVIRKKIADIHAIDLARILVEDIVIDNWIYYSEKSTPDILKFYLSNADDDTINDPERGIIKRLLDVIPYGDDGYIPGRFEVDVMKTAISSGADPMVGFSDLQEIMKFFGGDIDWMPEGDLKRKLKLMKRSKKMFGM